MPGGGTGLGKIDYAGEETKGVKFTRAKWARIGRYFAPYRGLIALTLISVIAGASVGLFPPLAIRTIIDDALPEGDSLLLGLLVLALVFLPIVEGLLGVVQQYLNTRIGQAVMRDLRLQLFRHIQRMSLRFFTHTKTGDIISRVNMDVSGVQDVVTRIFVNIATNIFIILSTTAVIFLLDWKLTLLSFIAMPVLIAPVRRVGKMRQRFRRNAQEEYSQITGILQESFGISGAILVKSFGQEDYEAERFAHHSNKLMGLEVKVRLVGRWFLMFVSLAAPLSAALVFWFGGQAVINGTMTIGTIVAFTAYLIRLYTPLSQLLNLHVDLLTSLALFGRIFEYLDMEPEVKDKDDAVSLPSAQGRINFEHVFFSYDSSEQVLKDISFQVEPGQLVALVGPSGAGKTTIVYLILRFYEPGEGTIRIDGHDIKNVSLQSLRAQFGMAMQETFLFHTTIRENLLYAKPEATELERITACQAAYIHDLIMSLPEGYDTVVGERGYRFSAGEKQRIALARVFLKDPRILVLDEATSAIDSQSENYIRAAMDSLMKNRTTLVIAHRLSTIMAADQILVLDKGRVVESGTHTELLSKEGLYSRLYHLQFHPQQA